MKTAKKEYNKCKCGRMKYKTADICWECFKKEARRQDDEKEALDKKEG